MRNALIELMASSDIEHITISEICATAGVNRSTFYRYYGSQYDLMDEIQEMFFKKLEESLGSGLISNKSSDGENENPMESTHLVKVLKYISLEKEAHTAMLEATNDEKFIERLFSLTTINEVFQSQIKSDISPEQKKYLRTFVFYGGYAIVKKWIASEDPESPEEIARIIYQLCSSVIY